MTESNTPQTTSPARNLRGYLTLAGISLIILGSLYLSDQYFQTGWLGWILLPALGAIFLAGSILARRIGLIIPACLVFGLGLGGYFALLRSLGLSPAGQIGALLLGFGLGWVMIVLISFLLLKMPAWWALIPGGVVFSAGACFLFSSLTVLDFVLYITLGLGLAFLVWGSVTHLFGLIIPGSLLVSIGLGIYLAWKPIAETNPLAQTGVMLVCFALGWGLIILFSRVTTQKFIWWPLIPGGLLAVVGWGLYIGGDPHNAVSFIGNTGSIGVIIFGLYLLLLRKGIQK